MAFDMARADAAGGMMRGEEPIDPSAMMPEEPMAPDQPADLDGALAGVEAAIGALGPEVQDEIRTHIEAIREAASRDVGPSMAERPPVEGGVPEEPKIAP